MKPRVLVLAVVIGLALWLLLLGILAIVLFR